MKHAEIIKGLLIAILYSIGLATSYFFHLPAPGDAIIHEAEHLMEEELNSLNDKH